MRRRCCMLGMAILVAAMLWSVATVAPSRNIDAVAAQPAHTIEAETATPHLRTASRQSGVRQSIADGAATLAALRGDAPSPLHMTEATSDTLAYGSAEPVLTGTTNTFSSVPNTIPSALAPLTFHTASDRLDAKTYGNQHAALDDGSGQDASLLKEFEYPARLVTSAPNDDVVGEGAGAPWLHSRADGLAKPIVAWLVALFVPFWLLRTPGRAGIVHCDGVLALGFPPMNMPYTTRRASPSTTRGTVLRGV